MIGSVEEAQLAEYKHRTRTRPRGWRTVGEGISRKAILSPTGVVYKIALYHEHEYESNEAEYRAFKRYRRWKSLPKMGVHIPAATLYSVGGDPVLAVEYIKRTGTTWCNRMRRDGEYRCTCEPLTRPNGLCYADLTAWLESQGMNDMHPDNLFVRDDKLFVIDLGYN